MSKPEDFQKDTSDYELDKLLSRRFGAFHRSMLGDCDSPVGAMHLKYQGAGFWQAVAKRINLDTGQPEVIFGRGSSFTKALRDLNAAIQNGAWRPDKPWVPKV